MKCKKCGNPLKKEDRYCGSCGEKVMLEKKKKPNKNYFYQFCIATNHYRKWIIVIAFIFLVLFGGYKIGQYFTSIEYTANRYFNTILHNDIDQLYNYIEEDKSDFVNKSLLKEKTTSLKNANHSTIVNIQTSKNEALVTYQYHEDGKIKIAYVSLEKEGTKYLLFNNWKVKSGKVSKNITFKIPKKATITIDGKDIQKYLSQEKTDEFYDYYQIDSMIFGNYQVAIQLESGIEVKEEVKVESNATYSIGTLEIEETIENKLEENVKNLLSSMYTSMLEGRSAEEVEGLNNPSLQRFYKDLKYYSTNQLSSLKQITFTDVELTHTHFNEEGKLVADFQTEYTYEVSYHYNSEEATYSGVNRGIASIIFDYNQEYIIYGIDNLKNSYPIRK